MTPTPIENILKCNPEIGDLVFIRVGGFLFGRVAKATRTWTSHVAILYGQDDEGRWLVGESKIPKSTITPLEHVLSKSEGGLYALRRLRGGLTDEEKEKVRKGVEARLNHWYHLGFKYESRRQFCSKFVRDILIEATGRELEPMLSFRDLREKYPDYPMTFWRWWYFGRIPWDRRTISPGDLFKSDDFVTLCDESGTKNNCNAGTCSGNTAG